MAEFDHLRFTLSRNAFGHLSLESDQGTFTDVVPVRAFPISDPDQSIAIVDREGHELVWLDQLNQTSAENQALINEELAAREFMPVLTKINDVSTLSLIHI